MSVPGECSKTNLKGGKKLQALLNRQLSGFPTQLCRVTSATERLTEGTAPILARAGELFFFTSVKTQCCKCWYRKRVSNTTRV